MIFENYALMRKIVFSLNIYQNVKVKLNIRHPSIRNKLILLCRNMYYVINVYKKYYNIYFYYYSSLSFSLSVNETFDIFLVSNVRLSFVLLIPSSKTIRENCLRFSALETLTQLI